LVPTLVSVAAVVSGSGRTVAAQAKLDDGQILASLEATYHHEVEHATLALERASLPEVKALAERVRDAYQTESTKAHELAGRLRISLVPREASAVADSHHAMLADMRAMKGIDFDRAYVEHEITGHQALLDYVTKTLLPSASNPELKALLQRLGPIIKSQIDEAKALKQRLNKA
jgi:putative membrane protein